MSSQFPDSPNFENYIQPFNIKNFNPGKQVTLYSEQKFFEGFDRGKRGVGTRNYIILLGTSVHTAGFVRQLADSFKKIPELFPNVDGVVPIAHTEGGTNEPFNNSELLLRTLSGFAVHPNVGAVLSVDFGTEQINNKVLKEYLEENKYPINMLIHNFFSIEFSYNEALSKASKIIEQWLPQLNNIHRSEQPYSKVKLALQCGGSDAFSGVSGNPLASWIGKEIIRYGGMVNLAETDELMGSEAYVLANVKDIETAERFLQLSERFKNWASRYGHSAEGNPSGGNIIRGLYNIAIKSIGAARKRHPDVRLDHVIEYGEPMTESGFYFMDSPGNDPESIAGQVASGANLVYFVTGNGSITNFPFVPTIKIMTTTERFELLHGDIDFNAGRFLEGESLDSLGENLMRLTQKVLSGQKSSGEKAGHSQINIWRDWYGKDAREVSCKKPEEVLIGKSLVLGYQSSKKPLFYEAVQVKGQYASEQVVLVMPTSLCSSEVAKMLVRHMTEKKIGSEKGISRFVALPHTEGCGNSSGKSMEKFIRTTLNYLLHPNVSMAISLEHGCEKAHNAYMCQEFEKIGGVVKKIGWFSIQLDGGIENVLKKATKWCQRNVANLKEESAKTTDAKDTRIGIITSGSMPRFVKGTLNVFCRRLLDAEMTVIAPESSALVNVLIKSGTLKEEQTHPTLAYGQQPSDSGFHIMENSFATLEETMAGMGGSGVQAIFSFLKGRPISAHPMIPVIQVRWNGNRSILYQNDFDLTLPESSSQGSAQLIELLEQVLSRKYIPKNNCSQNTIYQISRGIEGISL
ncbi:MAG: UxaA family hydrolase [SAR324 cluster bacterium]|nr:UxaA family hydrolase [SAR324 cluster bacterium]